MRVLPHIQRTVRSPRPPVIANCLCNREDVGFRECTLERRAAVSAGAEAHKLIGVLQVGAAIEIVPLQPTYIHQHLLGCRFACERRNRALAVHRYRRSFFYGIGHGSTFQISRAYSAMVRSLQNFPEPATLRMAFRVHAAGSAWSSQILRSAS